jgi:hypothetical protein
MHVAFPGDPRPSVVAALSPVPEAPMKSLALAAACTVAGVTSPAAAQDPVVRELLDVTVVMMRTQGFVQQGAFRFGRLNEGERGALRIDLMGGNNYIVIGVCDSDCDNLDLVLSNAAGTEVDSDYDLDDVPTLAAEVARNGTYQLTVSMASCSIEPCGYGIAVFAQAERSPTVNLDICVVENGQLNLKRASYNRSTGDTLYNGEAFHRTVDWRNYAASAPWFMGDEPIRVAGRTYVKSGAPRELGLDELEPWGEHGGVAVFNERGNAQAGVVYVPFLPGCRFQPYQVEGQAGAERSPLERALDTFTPAALSYAEQEGWRPQRVLLDYQFGDETVVAADVPNGVRAEISGQRVYLTQRAPRSGGEWGWRNLPHGDVMIRFNLRYESGNPNNGAGIQFRDGLQVVINASGEGGTRFILSTQRSDGERQHSPWKGSSGTGGRGDLKIEILAVGDLLTLFVNGTQIERVHVGSHHSRTGQVINLRVGGSDMTYSFGHMVVVELK